MKYVDLARFGGWMAALHAAHDVADHVIGQTDHQSAHKADPGWVGVKALTGHVGAYTAVQVAAVAGLSALTGARPGWRRVTAAVVWSAATHAFLDRRWPVRRVLELTGSPNFARPEVRVRGSVHESLLRGKPGWVEATGPLPLHGPNLADQALHHVALLVSAALLAPPSNDKEN